MAEPGAAFGPPGGSGEESISVVAAPLPGAGFALRDLGGPAQAGARFLETVVAPPGSGRATELLSATQRCGRCLHLCSACGRALVCGQQRHAIGLFGTNERCAVQPSDKL